MATNSIYGFGTGATNELTTAAYLADAQRTSGNVPGIARSQLVNKALHQLSTIAAGVAQFMADNQATDVVDTLTPAQVSTMLGASGRGRLINTIVQSTPGTYVYTPTPGTVYIEVEGCGGGGGGGGTTATTAAQQAAGAGGSGGGYFRKKIVAGFSGQSYTVGAAGVGGTGASPGTSGGTTSFGAIVGFPGGTAGSPGGAATIAGSATFPSGTAVPPVTGTGSADIFAAGGQGASAWYGPTAAAAGWGGNSYLGPGAYGPISSINLNSNGFPAASNGGGGGGALNGPSQATRAGGNGGTGVIIIREYS